ncbi:MAG: hypothetical protein PHN64_03895 [Desulfovibrionaceae bacterium]|nr:hypothetical protein [Desulfovibrionaceae bacterium]
MLADVWDDAFCDEQLCNMQRACAMYRRTGKRFPTPAHIFDLLPQCRQQGVQNDQQALPEITDAPASEWGQKASDVLAALRGDKDAAQRMKNLTRVACREVQ